MFSQHWGFRGRWSSLLTFLALVAGVSAAVAQPLPSAANSAVPGASAAPSETPSSTDDRSLRVGVAGSEPFVVSKNNVVDGMSVEVWREVARRADIRFELEPVDGVEELLERVADGKLDAAVGPISITAKRAQEVSFTQPYFHSSLAILAQSDSGGVMSVIGPFLSKAFVFGTGTLLLVLLLVGVLFWITERRKNPDMFPKDPVRGIGSGVWLALVTMTTVGYGDRVPVTAAGRVIGGVWMVLAMLTVSSLTAGIATTLTVASLSQGAIQSARELKGKRVAAIAGTTGARFARQNGARLVAADSVEQVLSLVSDGSVDAAIHDRPILKYALARSNHTGLELAEPVYEPQGYGFAVGSSDLRRQLDVALLEAAEAHRIEEVADRWLEGVGGDGD